MHQTAESESLLCITPQSQENKVSEKTPRCASQQGVSNLLSVCFDPKSSNFYFSVIFGYYYENYDVSHKLFKDIFNKM